VLCVRSLLPRLDPLLPSGGAVVFKLSVAAGIIFPCPVLPPASVGGVLFFAEEIQAAHRSAFF
jgi:hypothetical protein